MLDKPLTKPTYRPLDLIEYILEVKRSYEPITQEKFGSLFGMNPSQLSRILAGND